MATESSLGKIHIFPSEASYNTNKSSVSASDLAFVPTPRIPVETYRDGNQWYVKYSDGWCEQGDRLSDWNPVRNSGEVPVSFQVPFKENGQMMAIIMPLGIDRTNRSVATYSYKTYTNTGFISGFYGTGSSDCTTGAIWYACGYYK